MVSMSGQPWETILWDTGEMKLMGEYTEEAGLWLWALLGLGPGEASLCGNLVHLCIWLAPEQLWATE